VSRSASRPPSASAPRDADGRQRERLDAASFLKGMQLVGVGTATILSTGEPVVTVGLAMLVLGERLAPVQLLGGAIVLAALVGLARPRRLRGATSRRARVA
jgi:drug/metabolite transporter (DMT)-like permease